MKESPGIADTSYGRLNTQDLEQASDLVWSHIQARYEKCEGETGAGKGVWGLYGLSTD